MASLEELCSMELVSWYKRLQQHEQSSEFRLGRRHERNNNNKKNNNNMSDLLGFATVVTIYYFISKFS